ncbi:alpha-1,2-mannosidase, putative [Micrococcales bacterium KH10]|nr:alpha-1,2-mannosidase, putative [Micrococcales bacterium KH10]
MNKPALSTPARRSRRMGKRAVSAIAAAALVSSALVLPAVTATAAPSTTDYTQFVNPFIGTEDDFGQDGPGAFVPNGLAKVTPLTSPRSHVGYDYDSTIMRGFTGITLDGVGGNGAGGDFLVVPTYNSYTARPGTGTYNKGYSHANEEASPGYYSIENLTEGSRTIDARMTTDVRTGVHEYTFDQAGRGSLVIDLANNYGNRRGASLDVGTTAAGNTSLAGRLEGHFYNAPYQLYYYAETSRPVSTFSTWNDNNLNLGTRVQNGTDIGAILNFNVTAGEKVGLRVTFSPISAAQAKRDMAAEVGGKSFEDVHDAAIDAWNEALGVVDIEEDADDDPTGDLKIQFYTHLFRMNGSPINATSTDGTYRGVDGTIYQADGYTHYDSWALWDDFRKYSSIAMIYPDRYRDIGQSLVDLFIERGNSSSSSFNSLVHSVPTVRWERAAVVIADVISKGAELEGLDLAYATLKQHSNGQYNSTNESLGYIPNGVAETVGTSYDDWGMSVIADAIGNTADAEYFRNRSTNYVNSFNKNALASNGPAVTAGVSDVGLIMPRASNGSFGTQNPEQFEPSGAGLYQGTLWQYNWYVAQDMGGMIDLMGGQEAAQRAVRFHFGEQAPENCSRMLHSNANEIDLQAPYLFNYVGAPDRTQYWVRHILTEESCNRYIGTGSTGEMPSGGGEFNPPHKMYVYKNAPDGMLPTMDNDAGTMSSVFVGGAMGLFPVTSGSDSFQIASPLFEKITIRYPGGKNFVLESNGVNAENFYIQDATLNGAPLDRTWLSFDELTAGGTLSLNMGDEASDWGKDSPMAYSLSDEVSSRIYNPAQPVSTSAKVFKEAAANDGSIRNSLTLTAQGTTFAGANGADVSAHVQASGLPAGLSIRAVKSSNTTVTLSLQGNATNHGFNDSTDRLSVTLDAAAFAANAPSAADRTFDLKVAFEGYRTELSTQLVAAAANGDVDTEIVVSLTGGAQFAGSNGTVLDESVVELIGLASGLNAEVIKTSNTALSIAITGTLDAMATSTFVIVFSDDAFAGSVTAAQVTGDGLSGMSPVVVSAHADLRGGLSALIEEAKLVKRGNYSAASFVALTNAIDGAESTLADLQASDAALRQSTAALQSALDSLTLDEGGYRRLEAENNDIWSGGELKTEGGGTGTNIGGVERDSWVGYYGLDFSEAPLKSLIVAYAHNPGSASANSRMEIRTGSHDGELVTTINLPTTNGWANYTQLTHEFTPAEISALADAPDVYFVFRGGDDTNRRWVANFDYFEFIPDVDDEEDPDGPFEFAQLGPNNVTTMGPGMGRDGSAGAYTNFGNTHNEEWIHFAGVDFGPNGADTLSFSYDKPNSDRSQDGTWIDVRLGSPTGTTVASSVMLPRTGSGWGTYNIHEMNVDPAIFTGTQDVYIVFRMDPVHTSQGAPYVGNFRWFQFGDSTAQADNTRRTVEFESIRSGNGNLNAAPGLTEGVDYSGNGLKTENGNGGAVLAGTENGNWVRYQNVNLGEKFSSRILVTYDAPNHRVNEGSLAIYAGSMDGDPLIVTDLPNNNQTSWGTYETIAIDLPTELTGNNTLYFEFRSVPLPGVGNVGNFDSFALVYGQDKSDLRDAIADVEGLLDDEALYVAADFRVFEQALANARAVAANADATANQISTVTRQLNLAAGNLEWKVVRQLDNWIAKAEAVDESSVSPAAYAALLDALDAAKALDPATDSHADFVAALSALQTAYEDLDITYETALVGPSGDVEPGETVSITGSGFAAGEIVTFSWQGTPALTPDWTAMSNAAGEVATTVTIPVAATDGDYVLVATGAVSATPAQSTISVLKIVITTTTSFVTIPTEVVEGDQVQIVVGVSGGATGDVALSVDGAVVATESLNASGQATFTLNTLDEGTRTITAAYLGQDPYLPSTSSPATITVTPRPVVYDPTLVGPDGDVQPGETVSITGSGFAPDEVVTFTWQGTPALTADWTATANAAGEVATTVTIPASAADGDYVLVAEGAESAVPAQVTISVVKLVVSTQTSFLSIPTQAVAGDQVQIVVGVSGRATGDVALSVDGTVVATQSLNAQGQVTFTLDSLAEGTRTITAAYLGQDPYLPSTSSPATITVTAKPVDPKPDPVVVSVPTLSKAQQAFASKKKQRATITATVSGATAGTVTFTAGKTTLGSATLVKDGNQYRATLLIKGKLPRGKYGSMVATVRTTDGETVSSVASGATFRVVKATPKKARPKVTAKKFRAGTKPKVRVKISKLTNGRHAVGRVRIKVGSKTVTTVKLRKKNKGKVTITLPRSYSQQIRVSARYLPKKNKNIKKSKWSKKRTVQVRR